MAMKRAVVPCSVIAAALSIFIYFTAIAQPTKPAAEPAAVKVADGVWVLQHNGPLLGSNVGWIEFADFLVVIDTAFPAGAERALASIRAVSQKPIRYAVVTHWHQDHSFGGGVFAKEGAIIVAHENARRDFLARALDVYSKRQKTDSITAKYRPYAPDITFTDKMVLDDGKQRRLELLYLGHAHTNGDIFAWLPKEKILFTGDATVNKRKGYLADSNTASWIEVLTRAQALKPNTIAPGHGPVGSAEVLATFKRYFIDLRKLVAADVAQRKTLGQVQSSLDIPWWKQWTGETQMNVDHIAHVYGELTN
jgi:cyclase